MQNDRQFCPLVVAHRGSSAHHPENTLEAFQAAIDEGADIVELDARLTSDGVAVVLHDADVAATTEGSGLVHLLTLRQVQELDASGRGTGARIPTLREALDVLSGHAGVDIEIKSAPGEPSFHRPRGEVAEEVVRVLRKARFDGVMLVSSFDRMAIERVRALDPAIPTGFLTVSAVDPGAALAYVASIGHDYLLPQAPALYEAGGALVRAAHDQGVLVGTWTVDDPEAIDRLFEMGVDAVATNDPAAAIPVRDRHREGCEPIRSERPGRPGPTR